MSLQWVRTLFDNLHYFLFSKFSLVHNLMKHEFCGDFSWFDKSHIQIAAQTVIFICKKLINVRCHSKPSFLPFVSVLNQSVIHYFVIVTGPCGFGGLHLGKVHPCHYISDCLWLFTKFCRTFILYDQIQFNSLFQTRGLHDDVCMKICGWMDKSYIYVDDNHMLVFVILQGNNEL